VATFQFLYDDALHTELGTNDTAVLFTTAKRKKAINEGLRQFAALTECWVKESTIGDPLGRLRPHGDGWPRVHSLRQ
jgi:hypothetical protein